MKLVEDLISEFNGFQRCFLQPHGCNCGASETSSEDCPVGKWNEDIVFGSRLILWKSSHVRQMLERWPTARFLRPLQPRSISVLWGTLI